MEPLEATSLPWAQGVGRSNRPAPTKYYGFQWLTGFFQFMDWFVSPRARWSGIGRPSGSSGSFPLTEDGLKEFAESGCAGMVRKIPIPSDTAPNGWIRLPKVQARNCGKVSTLTRRKGRRTGLPTSRNRHRNIRAETAPDICGYRSLIALTCGSDGRLCPGPLCSGA
jgi:hypothetical protein